LQWLNINYYGYRMLLKHWITPWVGCLGDNREYLSKSNTDVRIRFPL
jgi:hypothetical protein